MEAEFKANANLKPVTVGDTLRITSFCSVASVALEITARVLTLQGKIKLLSHQHAPNSDRTALNSFVTLIDGHLLSLTVTVNSGTILRGQCFVRVAIQRGKLASAAIHDLLISDYVQTSLATGWPGGTVRLPTQGPGHINARTITAPGASNQFTHTVPSGARERFLALRFILNTDANAANRLVAVNFTDGTNTILQMASTNSVAANDSDNFNFLPGYPVQETFTESMVPGVFRHIMLAAWTMSSAIQNLQAGDTITTITLVTEDWIDP